MSVSSKIIEKSASSVNWPPFLWGLGAIAFLAAWGQIITYQFVWDDIATFLTNPSLLRWSTLYRAWANDFWALHEISERSGYWRPVPTVVYTMVGKIFGVHAGVFHFLSVLLHATNTLLVAVFFKRLGFRNFPLLVGTFFWALHPIHSETISFASALPDLLSAFFGLAALVSAVSAKNIKHGLLACALFALALASKESAIVFPVVFGLFCVLWPEAHSGFFARRKAWLPPIVIMIGYFFIHLAVSGTDVVRPLWGGTLVRHMATITNVALFQVSQSLFAWRLSPTQTFPISPGLSDPWFWSSAIFILAFISVLLWLCRKGERQVVLAIAVGVVFYLPVSNLLPAEGLVADRYLYLPTLAPALLIALVVKRMTEGSAVSVFRVLLLVFLGVLGIRAALASHHWRTEEKLWARAVQVTPASSEAWNQWGRVKLSHGDLKAACSAFETAVRLTPAHDLARENLILCAIERGHLDEALKHLKVAIQSNPGRASLWNLLAETYARQNQIEHALDAAREAALLEPGNWRYRYNLGTTYLMLNRTEEAANELKAATEYAPGRAIVWKNYGQALLQEGRYADAKNAYSTALRLDPKNVALQTEIDRVDALIELTKDVGP